jgi:hypothetical protein
VDAVRHTCVVCVSVPRTDVRFVSRSRGLVSFRRTHGGVPKRGTTTGLTCSPADVVAIAATVGYRLTRGARSRTEVVAAVHGRTTVQTGA